MESLENLLDVIFEKQDIMEQTYLSLDTLSNECQQIMNMLDSYDSNDVNQEIQNRIQKLHETASNLELKQKFNQGQRQLHSSINAFGRALTHGFGSSFDDFAQDVHIPPNIVYTLISEHMMSYGHGDLSYKIMKACNMSISEESISLYEKLNEYLKEIRKKNVKPALDWVEENREKIGKSDLEFSLHKLNFLYLINENRGEKSLEYAQKHFHKFKSTDLLEIYSLMGSLAFTGSINNNPYRNLKSDECRMRVESLFYYEFCKLNNLPTVSHLYSLIRAGIQGLPNFIKVKSLTPLENWNQSDKINVEIQLPNDVVFHSIFCCPVSKEISTPENPPMLLSCGHVISKNSVNSLQTSRNRYTDFSVRFKCPYCPQKIQPNMVRAISFD